MKLSARFRSPRTFLFYHNFKRLSRTFFEVFQLFRSSSQSALVAIRSALAAAFRLYHTRNRLSRTFFISFQTFSTARNQAFAQHSLFSLPHLSLFVKSFFKFFQTQNCLNSSSDPVSCSLPLSRQLEYLSTSSSVCQDPFFRFFLIDLWSRAPDTPALPYSAALPDSLHILAHT